jgi:hypothetical protein
LEQLITVIKTIEHNTKKPKTNKIAYGLTICYQTAGICGISIALFLSCTMLYILWIGFYPPGQNSNRIFFIDRLHDFKLLLEGLRSGSIQENFIQSVILAVEKVIQERYSNDIPSLPSFPK